LPTTLRIMHALARAGADVIELGVPFSDPLADGPVNQAAYERALKSGATVGGLLDLVAEFRRVGAPPRLPRAQSKGGRSNTAEHPSPRLRGPRGGCATSCDTPVVLMTYSNPVAQYGWGKFARDAQQAGADGVLLTDLPPEEAQEWLRHARAAGLDTIFLLAPTSPDERIALVAKLATGYVYCVSRLGVTGVRDQLPPDARGLVERVHSVGPLRPTKLGFEAREGGADGCPPRLPVVVGFGLSKPEQIRAVCEFADGAVVGSALVELIARHAAEQDFEPAVEEFVAALKRATR
jgi:tryptophan synthase alpha chain